MTGEQRAAFVKARVEKILSLYQETHDAMSSMPPHERDLWVHRRVERDLFTSESILSKIAAYVRERTTAWRDIVALDVLTLGALVVIFSSLVFDILDGVNVQAIVIHLASGFLAVATMMVISRVINYRLRAKATLIFDEMQAHVNHEINTFTLDFLADQIDIVNGDAELMQREVLSMVSAAGDSSE